MSTHLTVTRTEPITPTLQRVWFKSDDLSAFADSEFTDRYVKLVFPKPGVDYRPDPAADWHLLAGDEAAVPAIAAAVADLPDDASGHVVLLVDGAEHEPQLKASAGVEVTFVRRDGGAQQLADAVRTLPWREGRVHAFVHGEAEEVMKGVRPYLVKERGLARDQTSISGYWRRGASEDGFRVWKSQQRDDA